MCFYCDNKCKINENSNHCICMKSLSDGLVITCKDEMLNTSTKSFDKKDTHKMDCYFLHNILLAVKCLFVATLKIYKKNSII